MKCPEKPDVYSTAQLDELGLVDNPVRREIKGDAERGSGLRWLPSEAVDDDIRGCPVPKIDGSLPSRNRAVEAEEVKHKNDFRRRSINAKYNEVFHNLDAIRFNLAATKMALMRP